MRLTSKRWLTILTLLFVGSCLCMAEPAWVDTLPSFYKKSFMNVELWQWFGLLGTIVIGAVAGLIGAIIVKLILRARTKVYERQYMATTGRNAIRAGGLLVFAVTMGIVETQLGLSSHPERIARTLIDILQVIGVVLALCAVWDVVSTEIGRRVPGTKSNEKLLLPVIYKLVRGVLFGVGFLFIVAEVTNINITALVASLGLGGVVLALAAKDSIENIFGSITILFDRPFAIGDWVKTNSVEGIIEEINLRSTKIRTFEDTVVTLPNANLIRAPVENFTARRFRRHKLYLRLSYANRAEQVEKYCDLLRESVLKMPEAASEKTVVELNSMDETSMGILLQTTFEADDYQTEMGLRRSLLAKALRIGHDLGIQFVNPPLLYVPSPAPPSASKEPESPK